MEVVCVSDVELSAGFPIISYRQILNYRIKGSTDFPKIWVPPPNSKRQKSDVKHTQILGPPIKFLVARATLRPEFLHL